MRYSASNSGNLALVHPLSPLARLAATTVSSVGCIHTRTVTLAHVDRRERRY